MMILNDLLRPWFSNRFCRYSSEVSARVTMALLC